MTTFIRTFSFALIAASLGLGTIPALAQGAMKNDAMHGDSMKKDSMKGHAMHADGMKHHTTKKDSMQAHSMKMHTHSMKEPTMKKN